MSTSGSNADVIVFGGTFDPVHVGHISVAEQVLRALGAGEIWLMPAGRPALRDAPIASEDERLAMLRAAIASCSGFRVRDDELRRSAPSFTVDTMRDLRKEFPGTHFRLLIGADAARSMPRWDRASQLLRDEEFVIVNRAGVDDLGLEEAKALGFTAPRLRLLTVASPDVSASEVRRRAAAGESLTGLVPPEVDRLIAERGVYAAKTPPRA